MIPHAWLRVFASLFSCRHRSLAWPRTRRWRNALGIHFRRSHRTCLDCGQPVPYLGPLVN